MMDAHVIEYQWQLYYIAEEAETYYEGQIWFCESALDFILV